MTRRDLETLTRPGGLVPVDIETTAALVREVIKLRKALLTISEDGKNCEGYCRRQAARAIETIRSTLTSTDGGGK